MKTGNLLGVVTVLSTLIAADAQARVIRRDGYVGRPLARQAAWNNGVGYRPLARNVAWRGGTRHRTIASADIGSGRIARRDISRRGFCRDMDMGETSNFVTTTRTTTWRNTGSAPTIALAGSLPADDTFVEPVRTTAWRETNVEPTFALTGTEPMTTTTAWVEPRRTRVVSTRTVRTFAVAGTAPVDADYVEPIATTTWRRTRPVRTFALTGSAPEVITDVAPARTVSTTRVIQTSQPNLVEDRRLVNARIVANNWNDRRIDYPTYRVSRDAVRTRAVAISSPVIEPAPVIAEGPIVTTRRVAIARPAIVRTAVVTPAVVTTAPTIALAGSSTVLAVQERLADAGYFDGPFTGVVDYRTRSAILRYERDNGLPAGRSINGPLMISLGLQ